MFPNETLYAAKQKIVKGFERRYWIGAYAITTLESITYLPRSG